MANSILKLNVESSEYDAKLKRAVEGIQHLAEVAHRSGGDFAGLEKAELDYIKALGDMDTKSRTAAGTTRELENAFKELTVVYNQLNDVEKADEGGKALAASLETLKQRAQDARAQLDTATKSLQSNASAGSEDSSMLSQLADKFTINIDALKLFDIGLKAANMALDVAKDAFFQSESNIDEWGRTVEGAKGAYDVFLNALNSGNWSNFFSNIDKAIQGGRDLYNALDRLGSIKSNNQAAIAIVQQQIAQLRLAKNQGENVDAQLKAATEKLAALQKQSVEAGKIAGSKQISQTIANSYNTSEGANGILGPQTIDRVVKEITTQGQAAFDKYAKQYANFQKQGQDTRLRTYTGSGGASYSVEENYFNINKLTKEQQKQYALAKAITERETEIQRGIATYAQAVSEGTAAAREEFKGNRYANAKTPGTGGSGDKKTGATPQQQAEKQVSDALLSYQQSIDKARMELEAGIITDADVKKRNLQAQEQLWTAYGKAYDTYADPRYKEAQESAAREVVRLGGEVKTLADAQAASKKASAELQAAEKKLADAQRALAEANASGNLKDIRKAEGMVSAAQSEVDRLHPAEVTVIPKFSKVWHNLPDEVKKQLENVGQPEVNITASTENINTQVEYLKNKLASLSIGSTDYMLTAENLVDAETLQAAISEAVAKGLTPNEEDVKRFWDPILKGEGINDDEWKEWLTKMGIDPTKLNKGGKEGSRDKEQTPGEYMQKEIAKIGNLTGGINQIASGIEALGVELPEGFKNAMSGIQAITSILSGIAATVIAIEAIAGVDAVTPIFANGGIVPHAANGYFVPGTRYSTDATPVMANAGELILNKAQQGVIASDLQGGIGNLDLSAVVTAEQIRFILKNNGSRTGRGEYIQSKFN